MYYITKIQLTLWPVCKHSYIIAVNESATYRLHTWEIKCYIHGK